MDIVTVTIPVLILHDLSHFSSEYSCMHNPDSAQIVKIAPTRSGPAVNIVIKLSAIMALVFASVCSQLYSPLHSPLWKFANLRRHFAKVCQLLRRPPNTTPPADILQVVAAGDQKLLCGGRRAALGCLDHDRDRAVSTRDFP